MKYPKFIKKKETIGVPAPSDGGYNSKKINKLSHAKDYFLKQGYKLELSKNIYNSNRGRSSNEFDRANELNEMFKNNNIDMIICAAGGDFLVEILPYIDFKLLKDNPKYVVGFSDSTSILYPITTKYDIATIYGSNFSAFGEEQFNQSHYDLLDIITGKRLIESSYELYEDSYTETITGLEAPKLTEKVIWKTLDNNKAEIEGRIIGGCFDCISNILGTKYDGVNEFNEKYKDDGIIWYFDNCELSMEDVIRVLWKMNELDYFKYAKGIIFGRFGNLNTYYNYDTKSCLEDSVISKLNIPIIYDADISHKAPSLTIINGSIAHIVCENGKGQIEFKLK